MSGHKSGTYQTLDAWRGLASLWVVMFHMTLVIMVSYPQVHITPIYAFSLWGNLGVQVFFVISGYCIANAACKSLDRQQGFFSFMRARVRRIYPPVWAALVLASALSILASLLVTSGHLKSSTMGSENIMNQSIMYFVSNLTLTQCIFHQPFIIIQSWTLCYEMAFYLAVGILLIPSLFWRKRIPLLSSLHLMTGIILLLLIFLPSKVGYPFDLWPQFGLGILAYDVITHPQDWRPKASLGGVSTLFAAFCLTRSYPIGVMGEPSRLSFLFCLIFTGLIIVLYSYEDRFRDTRPIKALSALGLFSYSLYLTHTFSIGIVNQCVKVFHVPASLHYLVFAAVIAFAVGFARLFYQFFERPFIGSARKCIAEPMPSAAVALEAG